MDAKKIKSFIRRLKKEQASFGAMGGMLLAMDLQNLSIENLSLLNKEICKKGLAFDLIIKEMIRRSK